MYWVCKLSLCVFCVQTIVNDVGCIPHVYPCVHVVFVYFVSELCLCTWCMQVFEYTLYDHVILDGLHPSCRLCLLHGVQTPCRSFVYILYIHSMSGLSVHILDTDISVYLLSTPFSLIWSLCILHVW